jgi:hypothetical protein
MVTRWSFGDWSCSSNLTIRSTDPSVDETLSYPRTKIDSYVRSPRLAPGRARSLRNSDADAIGQKNRVCVLNRRIEHVSAQHMCGWGKCWAPHTWCINHTLKVFSPFLIINQPTQQ